MNSFYGGKQGRTYHIVERYDCVNINDFVKTYNDAVEANSSERTVDFISDKIKENQTGTTKTYITNIDINQGQVFKCNQNYYLVTAEKISKDTNISNILEDEEQVLLLQGMVQCFGLGGSYNKVNYGQYVIIDTIKNLNHKSDLQNGLLFRRGFDYNSKDLASQEKPDITTFNDSDGNFNKVAWQAAWSNWLQDVGGGAIYVGQIVGPEGSAPQLEPLSWEAFSDTSDTGKIKADRHVISPVSETSGLKENWKNIETIADRYDDTVKFGTATIKDSDGNITGAYIAFDIPMHTITVSGQSVDSYGFTPRQHFDEPSNQTDQDISIIPITDDEGKVIKYENLVHLHSQTGKNAGHPFYYNYDIAIPKGIHGTDLSQIKVKTGVIENTVNDQNTEIQITKTAEQIKDSQGKPLVEGDQYITFSLTDYNYLEGDQEDPNLGKVTSNHGRLPYRVINKIRQAYFKREFIDLPQNSTQVISAQVGALYKFPEKMITITENEEEKEINKNEDLYAVCIKAGNVTTDIQNWLKDELYVTRAGQPVQVSVAQGISYPIQYRANDSRWRSIKFNKPPAAGFQIDYTAGLSDFITTNFVDYIYLDDDGYLHAVYNNYQDNEKISPENQSDKDERVGQNIDATIGFIDSIKDINYNDGLVTFIFRDSNNTQSFDLNTIVDVQTYRSNLYVLFSSAELRQAYAEQEEHKEYEDYMYFPYSGINTESRFLQGEDQTGKGYIYIKVQATLPSNGYLVQGDYQLKDLIWVAEDNGTGSGYFNDVKYVGKIADAQASIWNTFDRDTKSSIISSEDSFYKTYIQPVTDTSDQHYPGIPVTFADNEYGRIITITTNITNENEEIVDRQITLYAYNFNRDKTPISYQLDEVFTENEIANLGLSGGTNYKAYTYWYITQQLYQASVSPSRIFIIDEEDSSKPEPQPAQQHLLNDQGLWFVTSFGHDVL